jgi:hypothetical protein
MAGAPDAKLPPHYWSQLSADDQSEFNKLRNSFHHGQQLASKDHRAPAFQRELSTVISYIERSSDNIEPRSILTGLCCVGRVICINTRQLKSFLCRCKSSINGSFQQLGFTAIRSKAKTRTCVTLALPSLQSQPGILRQWAARYTSEEAPVCFVSVFRFINIPDILPDDLFETKKVDDFEPQMPRRLPPPVHLAFPSAPLRATVLPFDLASVDFKPFATEEHRDLIAMKSSLSVGDFAGFDFDAGESSLFPPKKPNMKRSESHRVGFGKDWNFFDDDLPCFF